MRVCECKVIIGFLCKDATKRSRRLLYCIMVERLRPQGRNIELLRLALRDLGQSQHLELEEPSEDSKT
jgi:hypothetical protein